MDPEIEFEELKDPCETLRPTVDSNCNDEVNLENHTWMERVLMEEDRWVVDIGVEQVVDNEHH